MPQGTRHAQAWVPGVVCVRDACRVFEFPRRT